MILNNNITKGGAMREYTIIGCACGAVGKGGSSNYNTWRVYYKDYPPPNGYERMPAVAKKEKLRRLEKELAGHLQYIETWAYLLSPIKKTKTLNLRTVQSLLFLETCPRGLREPIYNRM